MIHYTDERPVWRNIFCSQWLVLINVCNATYCCWIHLLLSLQWDFIWACHQWRFSIMLVSGNEQAKLLMISITENVQWEQWKLICMNVTRVQLLWHFFFACFTAMHCVQIYRNHNQLSKSVAARNLFPMKQLFVK